MGLFFNNPAGPTDRSAPGLDRFRQIGRLEGEKILKGLSPTDKGKLAGYMKDLGTGRKSIAILSAKIFKEHGSVLKSRFLKAAEKHFSPVGLTAQEVKRNLKYNMQKDTSGLESLRPKKDSLSIFGAAKRPEGLGVKKPTTGFANNKTNTGFAQGGGNKNPSGFASPIKR